MHEKLATSAYLGSGLVADLVNSPATSSEMSEVLINQFQKSDFVELTLYPESNLVSIQSTDKLKEVGVRLKASPPQFLGSFSREKLIEDTEHWYSEVKHKIKSFPIESSIELLYYPSYQMLLLRDSKTLRSELVQNIDLR